MFCIFVSTLSFYNLFFCIFLIFFFFFFFFVCVFFFFFFFFFSSRRRHTRFDCDWSSDVCSSDLLSVHEVEVPRGDPDEGGTNVDDDKLAYFSWYAGGFRVIDFTNPADRKSVV